MATISSAVDFKTLIDINSVYTVQDQSTYSVEDLAWATANSRILLKAVDPLGNTFYENTDTANPDIDRSSTDVSANMNLPTDTAGNIIQGDYTITGTYFDNANLTPTSFDAGLVGTVANAIRVTSNTFVTGQAIVYDANGGTVPSGLTDGTTYFVHNISTATDIFLADTYANAVSGSNIAIPNAPSIGAGTQIFTAVQYERTFVVDYTFVTPTIDMDTSWSVINPVYFKNVDNTTYAYNNLSYTLTQTQTLYNPPVIGGSVQQLGKTFNAATFYTTTSTMELVSALAYSLTGYWSDASATVINTQATLTATLTKRSEVYVDGTNSVCQMYCCVKGAWDNYQTARVAMSSSTDSKHQIARDAMNNYFMMKQAFECNQSEDVAGFRAEIQRLTKCSGDNCECSDDAPTQVIGIGNTSEIVKKYTFTATANITSYTEAELIGLSYTNGDFIVFVDGEEVDSSGTNPTFNSGTGEFIFGYTVFSGSTIVINVVKR